MLDTLQAVEYASLSAKQKLKHVATKSKAESSLLKMQNKELTKQLSASREDFRKHRRAKPTDKFTEDWEEAEKLVGQDKCMVQSTILMKWVADKHMVKTEK